MDRIVHRFNTADMVGTHGMFHLPVHVAVLQLVEQKKLRCHWFNRTKQYAIQLCLSKLYIKDAILPHASHSIFIWHYRDNVLS